MRNRTLATDVLADEIANTCLSPNYEARDVSCLIKANISDLTDEQALKVASLVESLLAKREENYVEIVATAPVAFKLRNRKTRPVIEELIAKAKSSITLTGYAISENFSDLLTLIEEKSRQGIMVKIFLNDYEGTKKLFSSFNYKGRRFLKVYDYVGGGKDKMAALHAKTIVVDDETVLISSANLSYHGLDRNVEIGALIKSKEKARQVTEILSELIRQKIFALIE